MLPGFYEKTVVNIIGLQGKNTKKKMNEKIVKPGKVKFISD